MNCCIIVDAYSSGNLLAPELKSRGVECVHIQSTAEIPAAFRSSFHVEHFTTNIVHEGDAGKTLALCNKYQVSCVIAGCEIGVELADELSERLGLLSNGVRLSGTRRDKYKMVSQIETQGVRCIPSLKTGDYDEALRWVKQKVGWPVIVKPLRSAGSDLVSTCDSDAQLRKKFDVMIGNRDQFGILISEVLVQKKVHGSQYTVDTVSRHGKHHVTNIWSIVKGSHNGWDFVCEYDELLSYRKVEIDIVNYTFNVLDALGIKYGPTHTELMMLEDGPILIEVGSRLHGAGFAIYSRECVGYSQVDMTVDAYIDEGAFLDKAQAPYELKKNLVIVELISGVKGMLKAISHIDKIQGLSSFFAMKLRLRPGDFIEKTINVISSPGHVVLIHSNMEVIRKDYEIIRDLERNGLYEV
jgi:biotin carboxylase